jgi:hypothetical protein
MPATLARPTQFGQYAAPDPLSELTSIHLFDGATPLKEVDHEPKIAVLDQEDLLKQGIHVSQFIPGAQDVDALGSCTANTETEALSRILSPEGFAAYIAKEGAQDAPAAADLYTDTVAAERAAIGFYHGCTDQTGNTQSEYPPTDCGSSGPFMYQYSVSQGWVASQRIAHGADNVCSMMQADGALVGTPFFYAWMQPDANHFIDGNGSTSAIQAAIASGVAGGHEIYFSAIEKLTLLQTGHVDPFNTVIRFRNHWTASWGDNGSAYVHLSSFVALGANVDYRQFLAA